MNIIKKLAETTLFIGLVMVPLCGFSAVSTVAYKIPFYALSGSARGIWGLSALAGLGGYVYEKLEGEEHVLLKRLLATSNSIVGTGVKVLGDHVTDKSTFVFVTAPSVPLEAVQPALSYPVVASIGTYGVKPSFLLTGAVLALGAGYCLHQGINPFKVSFQAWNDLIDRKKARRLAAQ